MKKGTFTLPTLQEAQNQYDNIGAYNQLQAMMKAGQKLSVKFYTGKDNKPRAWIESKWKSHTNLTHPGKYFRPSKVKIMRPTSPK